MPTVFIALQCCQCSTMQVKQQKKSSSKWTCVVCNQKQSVRKVYAQGFMAKDVRKFVQNFNMSRQLAEQNLPNSDVPKETLEIGDHIPGIGKQKRTDWTEYIDPEDDSLNAPDFLDENNGNEFEPKIVTEMPKPVFKKPKLKSYCFGKDHADGDDESWENFGGRQTRTKDKSYAVGSSRYRDVTVRETQQQRTDYVAAMKGRFADTEEVMKLELPSDEISKRKGGLTQEDDAKFANQLTWRTQPSTGKGVGTSKWSCYIAAAAEEDGDLLLGRGKDMKTQARGWNDQHAFEAEFTDQRVEEDIHPDFL